MKIITLTELRKQSPISAGKLIQALNRNRYTPKTRTNLKKLGIKNGFITLKIQ